MRFVAQRLRLVRIAYGRIHGFGREMSQSAISRLAGLKVSAWNNVETGANKLGIDSAIKVARLTGVSLDYLFLGNAAGLPRAMAVEIAKLKRSKAR